MEWIATILVILVGGILGSFIFIQEKKKSQYQKLDKKMNKDKEKYDNMSDEEKVKLGNKWLKERRDK